MPYLGHAWADEKKAPLVSVGNPCKCDACGPINADIYVEETTTSPSP